MSETHKPIVRFSIFERIEHVVLVISFTLLAVTGLPQKFALNPISQEVIAFFGGIEAIRVIHHIAAAVFLLEAVYHAVVVGYKLFVQRKEATMIPVVKDGKDAFEWFGYNIGIQKTLPKMPRYNFMEKAEYWAMLWGLILMGLTGLMLWNPIATTNVLPGDFIPAAKAAHGAEAILAVLAIILWHFYHVHIKHWNWSMIKGTMSRHEMEVEHGEELEKIQTGRVPATPEPDMLRKRLALFVPVAAVFSLVLAGLTYYFLTFETTSITTLPPAERVEVFSPQTPTPVPTEAPKPTAAAPAQGVVLAWTGSLDNIMQEKCASCHGTMGGFNAETYEEVMKFVEPGNPDNSKIVQAQQGGNHPGQFSDEELNLLIQWIQAGAPQEAGGASGAQPTQAAAPASSETWSAGMETLFTERCGSCHGDTGGFTATTYEDVMNQVTAGDPDNSGVVSSQTAGTHPGQFSEEELNRVIEWIKAGAPQ
jgi:cytochrome b subunit of formate dehydrogenase/mono/diheme cytochrome c family protein